MALRVTTPATVNPVSLAEAKDHLRVTGDDENSLIVNLIKAASEAARQITRRQFVNATYTLDLPDFPSGDIELEFPPLSSVTSVKYYDVANDQQTLSASTDYEVDTYSTPGRIVLRVNESWPDVYDRALPVTIVYVAGYGAAASSVPEPIRQAILLLVGHLYENREATTPQTLSDTPMAVQWLLGPYAWPEMV